MYKDLDGAIADDAIILHGKQLFIDDYLIGELNGASKTLNQPVKHPSNPLLHKNDREYAMAYGALVRDETDGLATLRLDGFVSVEADIEGTLATKPLIFLGETLVVNANAEGGALVVEAVDSKGQVIAGFAAADCTPITTDSVRHIVAWKENTDCYLLQARPIRLRFHLKQSKLYSFEPTIRNNHYLQSYD